MIKSQVKHKIFFKIDLPDVEERIGSYAALLADLEPARFQTLYSLFQVCFLFFSFSFSFLIAKKKKERR